MLLSLVLALGLSEVLVRGSGVDIHPAAKLQFHPRYGWTMDPAWRLDGLKSSGFRTPDAVAQRGSGPRLLLLGDSFSVAVEQPWDSTFAGLLAAQVGPIGGSLLNLSSGGWGTAQQYLALMDEGLDWEPDVVVLQIFPFNDLCNNGIELAHTCSWQDHLRPYFVQGSGGLEPTWLEPWIGRARRRSRLVGLADRFVWSRRLGSPGESIEAFRARTREFTRENAKRLGLGHEGQVYSLLPSPEQPPAVRQAWDVTEALLAEIANELAARDIPLLAVVVPFSRSFEPDWQEYRRRRPAGIEADHGTRRTEAALMRLGVPTISVRGRIAEHGLVAADLYLRRNRHLNATGHRWVAEWILAALAELGLDSRADSLGGL